MADEQNNNNSVNLLNDNSNSSSSSSSSSIPVNVLNIEYDENNLDSLSNEQLIELFSNLKIMTINNLQLNPIDNKGNTPIALAIENRHMVCTYVVLNKFLRIYADVQKHKNLITKLVEIGYELSDDILQSLSCDNIADYLSNIFTLKNNDGNTYLHIAVHNNNIDYVRFLSYSNSEELCSYVENFNSDYPFISEYYEQIKEAQDASIANNAGVNPLDMAVLNSNVEMVSILLKFVNDNNVVKNAYDRSLAPDGSLTEISYLLKLD